MLSVGTMVSGGFRLVREQPFAVAIWGVVYLAGTIAMAFAMRPVTEMQVAAMAGGPEVQLSNIAMMTARLLLIQFAFLILVLILFNAPQRAVLRPEEGGFAFIRLGMDELRTIALTLFLIVLFYIGIFVFALAVGAAVAMVGVVVGPEAMVVLFIVQMLALLALMIWCQIRLSLVFPLTLLRRKIIIGESWRLTSGRFWTLFGGFFVLALIIFALALVITAVTAGPYLAELMREGLTLESMQAASQNQMMRQLEGIDAMTILGWVLTALLGALSLALFGGAAATVARELALDEEGIAQTFS